MIRQSSEEVGVDRQLLLMALDHSLKFVQVGLTRLLVQSPPVVVNLKGGKRAIDARLTQELVAIGCPGRAWQQKAEDTHEDGPEFPCSYHVLLRCKPAPRERGTQTVVCESSESIR